MSSPGKKRVASEESPDDETKRLCRLEERSDKLESIMSQILQAITTRKILVTPASAGPGPSAPGSCPPVMDHVASDPSVSSGPALQNPPVNLSESAPSGPDPSVQAQGSVAQGVAPAPPIHSALPGFGPQFSVDLEFLN
uniref:Uncharacterized protein n=1 Tax=Cacopsylla melanoneura TaxID=428564 RepID=A0A8D8TTZ3_9HEMI